jgi:hypothetical protein
LEAAVTAAGVCLRAEEVKEEELQALLVDEEETIDRDNIFDRMAANVAAHSVAYTAAIMSGSVLPLVSNPSMLMGLEFNDKPIVLRASVPIMPLDALELAALFNLGNGEKKSRYHTVDTLPSRNAEGSARELVKIRDDVGGYLNINGLDLNSPGTSLSGERVLNFGEFLLSKCCWTFYFVNSLVSYSRNTPLIQTQLERAPRRWPGSSYVPRIPSLEPTWFKIWKSTVDSTTTGQRYLFLSMARVCISTLRFAAETSTGRCFQIITFGCFKVICTLWMPWCSSPAHHGAMESTSRMCW